MRTLETGLAYFTLGMLAIYVPVETWASLPKGLGDPFYLVDLIAMILLLFGAVRSLRARPQSAPGFLCGGYAWAAANGWRATSRRLAMIAKGESLTHGDAELWFIGVGTAMALALMMVSLFLVAHTESKRGIA